MTRLYGEQDVNPDILRGQPIAFLGYGSQGRAQALNLRDSGFDVRIGVRPGGKSAQQAIEDGFEPRSFEDAVAGARVIGFFVPDTEQARLYREVVEPRLQAGQLLMFAHGFNVHYGQINPPEGIDVALVAPKSPGRLVRRQYQEGRGVPCLIAVHADPSGTARQRALAWAWGIGSARAGVLETTFAEETETDLFGEQAVLCGGATELIAAGFDTLTEAGYQPELAYFEVLHELKLIVDLLYEGGFAKMQEFVSDTAYWGDLKSGPRIVDASTRQRMREVLGEIQSGQFAREWIAESEAGKPNFKALLEKDLQHPIEAVGKALRARMSWLQGGAEEPSAKDQAA
ncbi:MAG: ketol-acid reductoisomerase [Xanthomonadales bacterium]|nr:ketol-acid reductoisomerase [Xanthomonadales bacterium]